MLIIKRIAATIIDILIYLFALLLLKYLLEIASIKNDDDILRIISYFIFILFPILYSNNGKTIGFFIFNINPDSKQRMLLKFLLYYMVYTGIIFIPVILRLWTADLNNQASLTFLPTLLSSAITLSSACLFLFSRGKYNLFDSILNLKFNGKDYKRNHFLFFGIWLLLGYCFFIPLILVHKKNALTTLEGIINEYDYQPSYYPDEVFDNYNDGQIIVDRKNVGDAFLVSKSGNFFHRDYINQRQILAALNKSTFLSPNRRLDLCIKLINYQLYDMLAQSANKKIDQIKIILSYSQPINFFVVKNYTYEYYYEIENNSKVYLYGGLDEKQLLKQYENSLDKFYAYQDSVLTRILNKPIDSIRNEKLFLTVEQRHQIDNSFRKYQFDDITVNVISPIYTEPSITYKVSFSLKDANGFHYDFTYEDNEKQLRHDSITNYRNTIDSILNE